ncbi:TolC family protein [Mucisphaera sp.]|uniref:TolC family protein n=1 Tax=Mucisphaera sp. TaxID=2913024 RepID=UPI003D097050
MTATHRFFPTRRLLAAGLVLSGLLSGCQSPLDHDPEIALRDAILNSHRAELEAMVTAPVTQVSREDSDVTAEMTDERLEELDEMSGVAAYANDPLELGPDLQGVLDGPRVRMTLRQAIETAVRNNVDLQVARFGPGIARAQRVQAEAAFDATLFADLGYFRTNTPGPRGSGGGFGSGVDVVSDSVSGQVGIRKNLISGGSAQVATSFTYTEDQFSGTTSFFDHDISATITQPLLRGFGRDVNLTQIQISRHAEAVSQQTLRQNLLALALSVEQAYWNLGVAEQTLLIQLRLLQRTEEDRNRLIKRQEFDVSPVRITEANSFVELRRAEVIRARQVVRQQSDTLKRLLGDNDLPIAGETLVLTTDRPPDQAIRYSLLDAVGTAIQRRPEVAISLYDIKDASLRMRLADNLRLPALDLTTGVAFNGVSVDSVGDAASNSIEGNYIDWNVGVAFEQPIGNRSAEAVLEQRRLERRAAAAAYERTVQDVILDVKNAMRSVINAYELIGSTKAARRATADSLRAIEEQEDAGVALTPEFLLDQKLATQQRLADAEIQEAQALADYATAIAQLYEVTGTLLERNSISIVAED